MVAATRLYTEEYFVNEMSAQGIPEMQRSNLVPCVIQVCSFVAMIYKDSCSIVLLLLLLTLLHSQWLSVYNSVSIYRVNNCREKKQA